MKDKSKDNLKYIEISKVDEEIKITYESRYTADDREKVKGNSKEKEKNTGEKKNEDDDDDEVDVITAAKYFKQS